MTNISSRDRLIHFILYVSDFCLISHQQVLFSYFDLLLHSAFTQDAYYITGSKLLKENVFTCFVSPLLSSPSSVPLCLITATLLLSLVA